MKSRQRRRFLSQSAALLGSGLLAGCNDGIDGVGAAPAPGGTAVADAMLPGTAAAPPAAGLASARPVAGPWTFQAASSAPGVSGAQLASAAELAGMAPATVPGTVLNSLIVNGTYPDPLHRRIVTDTVPDTLKDTDYWYRTRFDTPRLLPGQRLWLRFEGVNYKAAIWLNGASVGTLEGAFKHGSFDVTRLVPAAGGPAYLAVRVVKLDFSEGPLKPSYASGVTRGGRNGGPTGVTLKNGPTFFCTAGWDWLPTVPDRNLGIWRPVSWFTTGAARIADLRVDSTLSDDLRTAELRLDLALDNRGTSALAATVRGTLDGIAFRRDIRIPASDQPATVTLTSADIPELRLANPRLWWPNGYGKPELYRLSLRVEIGGQISDERTMNVGIRRIEYSRDIGLGTQLSLTVNKLPILAMGGNWGLDEAFKRIPRERLFHQVRLHRDANLNLIRNWNGQSTSEDFFDACDRYGILVWQDFFYSTEGPAPANVARDLDNIRDAIVHYRNHPSILLWCGGNEGSPPPALVDGLDRLVAELDPKRLCLTSSAGDTGAHAVNGYSSGGPYHWVAPKAHFSRGYGTLQVAFHNEVGSYSIPTLECVEAMLPPTSWEHPDDFWADRDVNGNGGNGGGAGYIALTGSRYGTAVNLPDFIRKSQLMNYECIKAIYEANAAVMIGPASATVTSPATGVIMWMTNPAQPSFVWQMYSHDLEQHASFFAVRHACRRVNVIMNANTLDVTIANHTAAALSGSVRILIHNLDGTLSSRTVQAVANVAAASFQVAANLAARIARASSAVCFVSLSLLDAGGSVLADNFYWYQTSGADSTYTSLDAMPAAAVSIAASATEADDGCATRIVADVKNIGGTIALMTHLQLFDTATGQRILPAFHSDNYLNLLPGASTQVTIEVPHASGQPPARAAIRVDGWKLDRGRCRLSPDGLPVTFNDRALAVTGPTTFAVS
ncbi:glycoside hydrolase family 2 protein [Burkholderia alba]|uniref:glycoside hydrolase family 2 protein n=1 Tax=Burkholderia alba TaxID=2683677 RepID=UPI002B059A23|nr:sugar-binding domain-containing protein [Burkholderia alba]